MAIFFSVMCNLALKLPYVLLRAGPTFCYVPPGPVVFVSKPYVLLHSSPTFCYVPCGPVVFFNIANVPSTFQLRSATFQPYVLLRAGPTFCFVPSVPIVRCKRFGAALRRHLDVQKKNPLYIYYIRNLDPGFLGFSMCFLGFPW